MDHPACRPATRDGNAPTRFPEARAAIPAGGYPQRPERAGQLAVVGSYEEWIVRELTRHMYGIVSLAVVACITEHVNQHTVPFSTLL